MALALCYLLKAGERRDGGIRGRLYMGLFKGNPLLILGNGAVGAEEQKLQNIGFYLSWRIISSSYCSSREEDERRADGDFC